MSTAPTNWLDDVTSDLPKMLTIAETAKTLRLSTRTVSRYVAAGRLHSVQHGPQGGRVRIARAELRRYLSSLEG